jgi:hypothetical protein
MGLDSANFAKPNSVCECRGLGMAEDDHRSIGRSFRTEISFWWWLIGIFGLAIGIISFIQHWFPVHLIPTYSQGLDVYRSVMHTSMGWLYWQFVWLAQYVSLTWFHWPLKISIPGWWKDLATISCLSSGIFFREFRDSHCISLRHVHCHEMQLLSPYSQVPRRWTDEGANADAEAASLHVPARRSDEMSFSYGRRAPTVLGSAWANSVSR